MRHSELLTLRDAWSAAGLDIEVLALIIDPAIAALEGIQEADRPSMREYHERVLSGEMSYTEALQEYVVGELPFERGFRQNFPNESRSTAFREALMQHVERRVLGDLAELEPYAVVDSRRRDLAAEREALPAEPNVRTATPAQVKAYQRTIEDADGIAAAEYALGQVSEVLWDLGLRPPERQPEPELEPENQDEDGSDPFHAQGYPEQPGMPGQPAPSFVEPSDGTETKVRVTR
jgi:hypothetical protein